MGYVKCIKEVAYYGSIRFEAGKLYRSTGKQGEVFDEDGQDHVIGLEGEEWFDEHFVCLTEEEELKFVEDYYKDMDNHDKEELEKLEKLKRQNEAYSQMLARIGEHMDDYMNSGLVDEYITLINIQSVFDEFRNK